MSVSWLAYCQPARSIPYPSTIQPVAFLIERVAGSRMSQALVHPGRNPETYDPSVADLMQYRDCKALFYVAPVLDGWAANFKECPSFALLPEARAGYHGKDHQHSHGSTGNADRNMDPHFWTDPHRVAEVLPRLQGLLIQQDLQSEQRIRSEIAILSREMETLELEAAKRLKHLQGKRAILMHSTYESFLTEHGIEIVAIVEPIPGKELSIKEWRYLLSLKPVDIIVHEKQLPLRQARILARELDARIVELDPMGSSARNLSELLSNQLEALAALRF
ncbi:MAG: zinc ABC transporter substrate-binding protein [Leptospiraceae bacterium]